MQHSTGIIGRVPVVDARGGATRHGIMVYAPFSHYAGRSPGAYIVGSYTGMEESIDSVALRFRRLEDVSTGAGIIHALLTSPSVIEMHQGQTQGEKARPAFAVHVALDAGVASRVHDPAPTTHRGTGARARKVVVWIEEAAPGGFVMVHGPARPSEGSNVRCPVPRVDPDGDVAGWEPRSLPWPVWMAFWYGTAWESWFDGLPAARRVGIALAAAGVALPPCQAKMRRRDWDRLCKGTVEGKST